jgi:hypothetical protein
MVTEDKKFAPNRILEDAGVAMLDELSRWVTHLEPVRRDAVGSAPRRPRR